MSYVQPCSYANDFVLPPSAFSLNTLSTIRLHDATIGYLATYLIIYNAATYATHRPFLPSMIQ